MNKSTEKVFTLEDFRKWGSQGGKSTLKKHGRKNFVKMAQTSNKVQKKGKS